MATRTKTVRKRDIACIRVGFEEYLLDADKAMQVIKLMRESVSCRKDFDGRRVRFLAGRAPELELSMVDESQVVMPGSSPALEDLRY